MKQLDDSQRARLADLADALMPSGEGLPAPSELDIHGMWINEALAAVPMMLPAVEIAIATPGDPKEVVQQMRADQPEIFMAFTFVLSGAYFMHPRVRQALGYQGLAIEPNPPLEGEAQYYLEDGLLDPVLSRGPIYRKVPETN